MCTNVPAAFGCAVELVIVNRDNSTLGTRQDPFVCDLVACADRLSKQLDQFLDRTLDSDIVEARAVGTGVGSRFEHDL